MDKMDEDKIAIAKMGVGAGGAVLYSYTLNEWVAIITIFYLLLQIVLLIPKYIDMFSMYLKKRSK
ncbi:hypothetical protein [Dyadobacter sp. CY356]|uniref:hypothetical protein n=1 Tax=Dyadobacter sp. CY356 TaxID=2906442 RepID=UPI001F429F2F|nr:hypothetical protein [Dyadobacter sp. CY356]